jgi:hypothetical protein
MVKGKSAGKYRVFVSHAGDDIWVARQIARCIEDCGANAFLDRRDIAAGDNFRQRIHDDIEKCKELMALFTPWSLHRAWIRHEIGMAEALRKRIVCVFYHVRGADFRADDDGLGPLEGLSTIEINDLDFYFKDLRSRVG